MKMGIKTPDGIHQVIFICMSRQEQERLDGILREVEPMNWWEESDKPWTRVEVDGSEADATAFYEMVHAKLYPDYQPDTFDYTHYL